MHMHVCMYASRDPVGLICMHVCVHTAVYALCVLLCPCMCVCMQGPCCVHFYVCRKPTMCVCAQMWQPKLRAHPLSGYPSYSFSTPSRGTSTQIIAVPETPQEWYPGTSPRAVHSPAHSLSTSWVKKQFLSLKQQEKQRLGSDG